MTNRTCGLRNCVLDANAVEAPDVGRRALMLYAAVAIATAFLAPVPRVVTAREREVFDAQAFRASRRSLRLACGNVAYVERGRGDVALFLHGFPLNSFQWRGAMERLSAQRRCIAPDFLALGYTEVRPGQSVAPQAQVSMIIALLDALSISRVDLVASDSGGAIAQLLVAHYPRRVRSLLLTNCDTEIESPPAAMGPVIELSKRGEFVDRWLAPWLADKTLARSPQGIGGMCYADPTQPTDEAIETYLAPFTASAARKALVHAYAIALERNALAGISAALRRNRVPASIVWGAADTIFSSKGADYLAATQGNCRSVRQLPGSKLFWPEERPDVIEREAMRLWAQT